MTIHFHGTPITPHKELMKLAGRHFCISFAQPQQVEDCHRIGQSVLIDNGAYTFWRMKSLPNWKGYYDFCNKWLIYPTTWAIIPDVIEGSEEENDKLIRQWPFGRLQGAPVWHLHEPIARLLFIRDMGFAKIAFGSSGEYKTIATRKWHYRIREAFDVLRGDGQSQRRLPWIHMLRGMKLSAGPYPFASLDSTDAARNHHRKNNVDQIVKEWDAMQCAPHWPRSYP